MRFLNYLTPNGSPTIKPVGINSIHAFPSDIAHYLGLSDADSYTGHCFCRSVYWL